jgi:transcriptional regulator with XRE-family HTH domain
MARRQASMTQAELADAVGVSQTMISTYELGGREPSLGTLARILKGAGCSLRLELIPYDDHDDVLEEIMDRNPGRREQHLENWARKAAAQKVVRDHERTRS